MCSITKTVLIGVFLVALLGPSRADQVEPFGISAVAANTGSLVEIWRGLKQQLYSSDVRTITSCGSDQTNECAAASKLLMIVKELANTREKPFLVTYIDPSIF